MHAAVVRSFDHAPRYELFDEPQPRTEDEIVVDVLAAAIHPRVRSGASGRHYTSTGRLPMIPGIDGVGRAADGRRLYFVCDDDVLGSMAERAVVDRRRTIALPDGVDANTIAAAMNPAMSSWVALRRRVALQPGQSVLILGATGNAGQMATQVAKHLGAGYVVGAGRDRARLGALASLGADATVALTDDTEATGAALAAAAADVDIVIDYVWGVPAQQAMMALVTGRTDRSRELNWVQIGALAGATIELPSALLRSANLRIQGNGQGAVSTRAYVAELPSLIETLDAGALKIETEAVPLSAVESAWNAPDGAMRRTVLCPQP